MISDLEGFVYPRVSLSLCVDCGLCEQVCPFLHPCSKRIPERTYAAKSEDDEVRLSSSSGGVFTELASWVIRQGGVVFAARFTDDWGVEHTFTEHLSDLHFFRGSKYVQSNIGNSYQQAFVFLKQGRRVLFTGTSCQIAGLNRYLKNRSYDLLLTVEVVCHGVPSPKVWKCYLKDLTGNKLEAISMIGFRSKETGWHNYSIVCEHNRRYVKSFRKDPYMKSFVSNFSLRPSCYACVCKQFATNSDLALGDFWGVDTLHPHLDDDKGIGLVFVHTAKAEKILKLLPIVCMEENYEHVIQFNNCIYASPHKPLLRYLFFGGIRMGVRFSSLVKWLSFLRSKNVMNRWYKIIVKKI